jgi:hypothetical protein
MQRLTSNAFAHRKAFLVRSFARAVFRFIAVALFLGEQTLSCHFKPLTFR